MRWIDGLAALAIAAAATFLAAQPWLVASEGSAFDGLLALRHQIYAQQVNGRSAPAVVVAMDRETALRPPFDRIPPELWTPQLAQVMSAVLEAGAVVVAQQQAFTASAEQVMPGHDTEYLAVLRSAGKADRLVLGRSEPGPDRLSPFPAHVEEVGGYRNVRSAELPVDSDGVVRRARLYVERVTPRGVPQLEPTLVLELAARARGERPQLVNGRDVELGGNRVPSSTGTMMLFNPEGGTGTVPVHSLADLYACVEAGDRDFFAEAFAGRVVIFGGSTAVRNRHPSSARLLGVSDRDRGANRCRLAPLRSLAGLPDAEGTTEAVITAIAVNTLVQGRTIDRLEHPVPMVIAGLLALAAAVAGLRVRFWFVLPAGLVFAAAWFYVAAMMLAREAWSMPLVQPLTAVLFSLLLAWGYCCLRPRRSRMTA